VKRRDFLKIAGVSTALTAAGCGFPTNQKLIPFLNPPENIIPGIPTWYATTCRQCPAGCGVWAKNREARIIKFEGAPEHPINRGKLCARGQAALEDIYHPDRLIDPVSRSGGESRLTWPQARAMLHAQAAAAGGKVAVLSGLETGYDAALLNGWLGGCGGTRATMFEPISYDELREANLAVYGTDDVPALDLSRSDLLVSIGADFLETWLSPVEFSAQFTAARERDVRKTGFVYAGPRMSATAAVADRWLPIQAGAEAHFAFALLAAAIDAGVSASADDLLCARAALGGAKTEDLARRCGVDEQLIRAVARRMVKEASQPYVLTAGSADAAIAANLLNHLTGGVRAVADFSRPLAYSRLARRAELEQFRKDLESGAIQALLVFRANPIYAWPGFAEAIAKVPFLAVIDSVETETTAKAHLVLPVHTPYETWGTYEPRRGVVGIIQPTMGALHPAAHLQQILAPAGGNPEPVEQHFARLGGAPLGLAGDPHAGDFRGLVARGFATPASGAATAPELKLTGYQFTAIAPRESLTVHGYPSLRWYDGRDANKNWLQEIPDPLTCMTWDGWVEMHPDTAAKLGVAQGDVVEVETRHGKGEAAVFLYRGVHPQTLAIPMGMGRSAGRYTRGSGVNPLALTRGRASAGDAKVRLTGRKIRLAHTDGSSQQFGREIARAIYEVAPPERPETEAVHLKYPVRVPIAANHDDKVDIYPPVEHSMYRWGMVVDLDKCSGCSACAAACYAENNVAIVGKERVLENRIMHWIFIQRYFEDGENPGVRFLPMLCQHCNNAPCEAVCPVYAPHHDSEGLNVQIYNRCIGTRYCGQNCPYKVRRFNFFKYTRTPPLNLQLNPDVTAREMGVMEKCSFCVQRIKQARQTANVEEREIRDGEVQPACVQTCPTGALSFGTFLDPASKVSRLAKDPRAYQVLDELNTRPGVIYLKKIVRDDKLGKA
jgi:molybdopterin-containing oxidoreductase family iron-sulfur binding subunit